MTSTGYKLPTVAAAIDRGGDAWTSPNSIKVDDDSGAYSNPSSGSTTNWLRGYHFDFAIPSGATIDNITVAIKRRSDTAGYMVMTDVRLLKNLVIAGDNKADSSKWSTTYGYVNHGGDLWGTTWTAEDINNDNFGVQIYATNTGKAACLAEIDAIKIAINYTEGLAHVDEINGINYASNIDQLGGLSTTNIAEKLGLT